MESLLKSWDLGPAIQDLVVSNIEEISVCEVEDLVADLDISEEKAQLIVDKANKAKLFEKRKSAINRSQKATEDSFGVVTTKLFYKRLSEQYPSVIPPPPPADMDAQAEKLFRTITLNVKYLDDVDGLIPILEELGKRVSHTTYISLMIQCQ